jgi:hypothetical protein
MVKLRELKEVGFKFRQQVPIDYFIVDFACCRNASSSRRATASLPGSRVRENEERGDE